MKNYSIAGLIGLISITIMLLLYWNPSSFSEVNVTEPRTIEEVGEVIGSINQQLSGLYSQKLEIEKQIKGVEQEKRYWDWYLQTKLNDLWVEYKPQEEIPAWALWKHEPNIDQQPQEKPQEMHLWTFATTRYYRPLENQVAYHWWDYQNEIYVNCWGASCQHTADWYSLSASDVGKIFACPPDIAMWTTLKLVYPYGYEMIGTCRDRWGKIKNKRLDIWSGIWEEWYANIFLKDPTPTPAHWEVEVYLLS